MKLRKAGGKCPCKSVKISKKIRVYLTFSRSQEDVFFATIRYYNGTFFLIAYGSSDIPRLEGHLHLPSANYSVFIEVLLVKHLERPSKTWHKFYFYSGSKLIRFSILESWSLGIKNLPMTYLPLATARRDRFIVWSVAFDGALTKLRKVTFSFIISVCPSIRPHGTPWFPLEALSLNFMFEYLLKICREKSTNVKKPDNKNRYFTWRPKYIYDVISLTSSKNEKYCRQYLYRKSKHTLTCNDIFFEYPAVH